MAVINAIRRELNIDPTGCLFHFDQNIYRKVQSIGLQGAYNTDNPEGVRKWIRRLMALQLVPPLRIQGVFGAIVQGAPNIPEANEMHQYVLNTYVDPNNARFDIGIWNALNTQDRTTNICEGFHSALNKSIGVYAPTIFQVIKCFQKMDQVQEREIAQLAFGANPKKRKAKYVRVDEVLTRLADHTFGHQIPNIASILGYLDAAAFQLWDLKH
jgi:hypothetical protein